MHLSRARIAYQKLAAGRKKPGEYEVKQPSSVNNKIMRAHENALAASLGQNTRPFRVDAIALCVGHIDNSESKRQQRQSFCVFSERFETGHHHLGLETITFVLLVQELDNPLAVVWRPPERANLKRLAGTQRFLPHVQIGAGADDQMHARDRSNARKLGQERCNLQQHPNESSAQLSITGTSGASELRRLSCTYRSTLSVAVPVLQRHRVETIRVELECPHKYWFGRPLVRQRW